MSPWYRTPLGSVYLSGDEEAAAYREQPCVRTGPPRFPDTTPRSVVDRIMAEDRADFDMAADGPREPFVPGTFEKPDSDAL